MKVMKVSCTVDTLESCHNSIKLIDSSLITIVHEPNNHLLIFASDYDQDGHVKANSMPIEELNKMDLTYKKKYQMISDKEFK
jgi:hypothetical protein